VTCKGQHAKRNRWQMSAKCRGRLHYTGSEAQVMVGVNAGGRRYEAKGSGEYQETRDWQEGK
jgi:hypothetical protein